MIQILILPAPRAQGQRVAMCLATLVNLVRQHRAPAALAAAVQHGGRAVDVFLKADKFLQQRLADSPAEATKLFKAVQATTRTLQAICGEAKTAGELSVAAKVPAVRRTLERFVLRVRGITQAAGNGPSAFWLGNLKHKGLDGREVPSQLYPGAEEDDVEEEGEDGGGGEESDPASKKRKLS